MRLRVCPNCKLVVYLLGVGQFEFDFAQWHQRCAAAGLDSLMRCPHFTRAIDEIGLLPMQPPFQKARPAN